MNSLTQKEINFIELLKEDLKYRGRKSFIETMFLAEFAPPDKLKKDVLEMFNEYYLEIFNNSDFIMESIESCYIGKYKDHFWGTGSEGELYGLGKEIQNIPYNLICSEIGDLSIEKNKIEAINYFKDCFDVDYDMQISKYKIFCESFGFNYVDNHDYIQNQVQEFNELIIQKS